MMKAFNFGRPPFLPTDRPTHFLKHLRTVKQFQKSFESPASFLPDCSDISVHQMQQSSTLVTATPLSFVVKQHVPNETCCFLRPIKFVTFGPLGLMMSNQIGTFQPTVQWNWNNFMHRPREDRESEHDVSEEF
jgi:hypothetical protein